MPFAPPVHRPPGWKPYVKPNRQRTDALDRSYGTQAWRKLAKAVIDRDGGICALCGKPGATLADHIVERRNGGSDHMENLRAAHIACHNRRHWAKQRV